MDLTQDRLPAGVDMLLRSRVAGGDLGVQGSSALADADSLSRTLGDRPHLAAEPPCGSPAPAWNMGAMCARLVNGQVGDEQYGAWRVMVHA